MKANKLALAGVLASAGVVSIAISAEDESTMHKLVPAMDIAPAKAQPVAAGELSSLSRATEWLNSQSLTADDLRGKVVLIDFWTYTCINWLRTVPYVRAWAEKYKDQGLVVIGVHAPEFVFERSIDNVRQAVKRTNVAYPVAADNRYGLVSSVFTRDIDRAFRYIENLPTGIVYAVWSGVGVVLIATIAWVFQSQKLDAAALCGVAKQTFMQVEHGHATCQLGSVLQICAGLGIQLCLLPWRSESERENDWQ